MVAVLASALLLAAPSKAATNRYWNDKTLDSRWTNTANLVCVAAGPGASRRIAERRGRGARAE